MSKQNLTQSQKVWIFRGFTLFMLAINAPAGYIVLCYLSDVFESILLLGRFEEPKAIPTGAAVTALATLTLFGWIFKTKVPALKEEFLGNKMVAQAAE